MEERQWLHDEAQREGGWNVSPSSGPKVIRAEKERESLEGQSREMPGKDARFARRRRQRDRCAGPQ